MNVVVSGPVAAALILAGLDLGSSFNLDDGSFNNCHDKIQAERPNLDREAVRILAIVESAKGLAKHLADVQAEHREKCGPDADAQAAYKKAKADKLAQLEKQAQEQRFADLVKMAEADAESEFEAKQFAEAPGSGSERYGQSRPDTENGPDANAAGQQTGGSTAAATQEEKKPEENKSEGEKKPVVN